MKKAIIIPAFNEEKRIQKLISEIKLISEDYEIIVIDDGSNDNTANAALSAGAVVISHPFNLGYGSALQTGYKYALKNYFDIIVQMDADGQHDPKYIPQMIDILANQDIDVLIGSRFKNKTNYKTTLARKLGIKLFSAITSLIIKKKITDATSGYQAIKAKVLPFLVSEFFPSDYPDADLLIMLDYNGFKIEEFAMEMYPDSQNKSMHKGFLKNIYYIFKMLISIFLLIISINFFKKNNNNKWKAI